MLVLTRKTKEEIRIGNDITVTIVRVKGQSVRVGINAPPHVHIMRSELSEGGERAQPTNADTNASTPKVRPARSLTESPNTPAVLGLVDERPSPNTAMTTKSASQHRTDSTKPSLDRRSRFDVPLGPTNLSHIAARQRLNKAHGRPHGSP